MLSWTRAVVLLAGIVLAGLSSLFLYARRHGVSEIRPTAPQLVEVEQSQRESDCWPGFGGGKGNVHESRDELPADWNENVGVAWKSAIMAHGHGSPIFWKDRIFLSVADEEAKSLALNCYERSRGDLVWQCPLYQGEFMSRHEKNSQASATPVCDGDRVYVPFIAEGSLWVTAIDMNGHLAWKTQVGPFTSQWGYGSSPVLFRNLVIVAGDNKGHRVANVASVTSYVAALDTRTGEIAWRVRRIPAPSYGTPIVAELAGRSQLVLAGAEKIVAYDPADGAELWSCRWSARRCAGCVAFGPDRIFASTTIPEPEMICVRADGRGDVSESHVLWRQRRGVPDVPTPVHHRGRLYVVNDKGVALCYDADTGKVLWQERLDGNFSSSPLLAGDRIYAVSEEGTTFVFRASEKFELLARNSLEDRVLASPVPMGPHLLLRGQRHLWNIGTERLVRIP